MWSTSRIIALISLIGSVCAALSPLVVDVNPKLAAIFAALGTVFAAFTERVNGGLGDRQKVAEVQGKIDRGEFK